MMLLSIDGQTVFAELDDKGNVVRFASYPVDAMDEHGNVDRSRGITVQPTAQDIEDAKRSVAAWRNSQPAVN
jgi:hypothetical protein